MLALRWVSLDSKDTTFVKICEFSIKYLVLMRLMIWFMPRILPSLKRRCARMLHRRKTLFMLIYMGILRISALERYLYVKWGILVSWRGVKLIGIGGFPVHTNGSFQWEEFIPFDELPFTFDPPEGAKINKKRA